MDALAAVVEAVAERPTDRRGEIGQPRPVDGGLDRVERVARVPERVAQVRRPEACRDPAPPERSADGDPAVAADEAADLADGGLDEPLRPARADEQERRLWPERSRRRR